MNIETVKVPVRQLEIGMHVVKLDRPWLETPFRLQGFRIRGDAELETLARYCRHVYVDVERSTGSLRIPGERVVLDEGGDVVRFTGSIPSNARERAAGREPETRTERVSREAARTALPPPTVSYALAASLEEELPRAGAAMTDAKLAVRACMHALRHGGAARVDAVRRAASALEASVLRNPDAAMLLRAVKTDEPFSFRHCVNSAVLGIAMARELGFRQQRIHELTMGILLADIGKMRLPKELLQTKRRLDERETAIMKLHVRYGIEMSATLRGLSAGSLEIIAAHHERFNGSGYPAGLRGGQIPLLGRIAGLVDSFDAITSERGYAKPIAASEAIRELYAATVDVFQRDLVECLIQVLGAYPVGSLVELSDGAVALVVGLNRERRLLPSVVVLSGPGREAGAPPRRLDLGGSSSSNLTVRDFLEGRRPGVPRPTVRLLDALVAAS